MATSNLSSLPSGPGVYLLQFSGTDKKYVGSSVNVKRRVKYHVADLRRGKHYNKHLQHVYCKYENLEASILQIVDNPEDLISAEQYWIDTLDTHQSGLNLSPKAYSCLGVRHTDAMKAKVSSIKKGSRHTDSHKANLSAANMTLSIQDLRRVFLIALEGASQRAIAKVVGVSQQTVANILRLKVQAYVRAANTDAELQRLAGLYNEKRSSSK